MNKIEVLHIQREIKITALPLCLGELTTLEAVWIDLNWMLRDVPLSLLLLPKVVELSLFNNDMSWDSLLEYNFGGDLEAAEQWFEDDFEWERHPICDDDDGECLFWMQHNPICNDFYEWDADSYSWVIDQNASALWPTNLIEFLNISCLSDNHCYISHVYDVSTDQCSPRLLGDGYCHTECQSKGCYWDYLDCAQVNMFLRATDVSIDDGVDQLCVAGNVTTCTVEEYFTLECQFRHMFQASSYVCGRMLCFCFQIL